VVAQTEQIPERDLKVEVRSGGRWVVATPLPKLQFEVPDG
jgi:hypothetical protein